MCPPAASFHIYLLLWPRSLFLGFRDCRLPPSKPSNLPCTSFLPHVAVATAAVAAQSFLGVPRLACAPFKTLEPSLQLPSTCSCGHCCSGHAIFSWGSKTAACPLQNPRTFPAASFHMHCCCSRTVFSWGSETAACPLQNPRTFPAASFRIQP